MEDHLEVEARDGGAGRTEVVPRGERSCATVSERPVCRPEPRKDPVTLTIESCRRRSCEDGIALEFDDGEIRFQALDDGAQEGPKHGVGGWDARAEIDPCSCSTPAMKLV